MDELLRQINEHFARQASDFSIYLDKEGRVKLSSGFSHVFIDPAKLQRFHDLVLTLRDGPVDCRVRTLSCGFII